MSDSRTAAFVDALHSLEREGDLEPIAGLFADDAELGNVTLGRSFRGQEGARVFWKAYRESFERIESEFAAAIAGGDASALEWRSTGELSGGAAFAYEGVSIIEWDGEQIRRFAAYFDPRTLD